MIQPSQYDRSSNQSLFDLSGMSVVVTGASQGLGRRLALAMALAGADVTLAARRVAQLEEVVQEITDTGAVAAAVPVDLMVDGAGEALLAATLELRGHVDVLVNNAGISPVVQDPQTYSLDDWNQIVGLNLRATFFCAQAFGKWMIDEERPGSIINVGSVAGMHAIRGVSVYAASKAGVIQLTKSLAYEWGPHGVRVNALCPGVFDSETTADLRSRDGRYYEHLLGRIPMERFGQAHELDAAAVFLASPGASYVTGSVLAVDGGWGTI
jgi:NAD(P)-dependent dehydrogenase (short-subunit alcohol dehydrogenase family)